MTPTLAALSLLLGLAIYFLPTFLARGKVHFSGILLLNIFLGWSLVGWVGALIWAVCADKDNFGKLPPPLYRLSKRQQEVFRD